MLILSSHAKYLEVTLAVNFIKFFRILFNRGVMKLFIKKDQAKGLLGGVKFELNARTKLTDEERALVNKYSADKEVLLKKEIKIPFTGNAIFLDITIGSLISGQAFKCNNIGEVLEYEKNIKESCKHFVTYLDVMKNFGGEEEIEFNA